MIEEIIQCERQADQVVTNSARQADRLRWRAAELISAEMDAGKTQRQLAEDTGKSVTHVGRMRRVFTHFHHVRDELRSFNSYYAEVKAGLRHG